VQLVGRETSGNLTESGEFHATLGIFHMPQIYDMGQTASVGFEPANLGTKGQHATPRPPKPLGPVLGLLDRFDAKGSALTRATRSWKTCAFILLTKHIKCLTVCLIKVNINDKKDNFNFSFKFTSKHQTRQSLFLALHNNL
jgi:hypothetical protein